MTINSKMVDQTSGKGKKNVKLTKQNVLKISESTKKTKYKNTILAPISWINSGKSVRKESKNSQSNSSIMKNEARTYGKSSFVEQEPIKPQPPSNNNHNGFHNS